MASVTDENLNEFTTKSPREVVYNLRQLIIAGERVSVMFHEGQESFLTILIDVDEDAGILYFDWGGSETTIRKFLQSERNFFICSPGGIRNQFMVGKVWETEVDKRKAFATYLPQSFTRLQRREFFRLSLPMSLRPQCSAQTAKHPQPLALSIVDISIGGVGIEIAQSKLDFVIGETIDRVGIPLGTFGRIDVNLKVRFSGQASRGGKEITVLGTEFVKLSGAQENIVQRFMTHIQRELKARAP